MRTARTLLRLALATAVTLAPARQRTRRPSDAAVKAAFLPRFARYVTWPPAALPKGSDPFVLCTIGDDPFGQLLDEAARTQTIDGHSIVVRRLSSADGADRCNIAFVEGSRSAAGRANARGDRLEAGADRDRRKQRRPARDHPFRGGQRPRALLHRRGRARRGAG